EVRFHREAEIRRLVAQAVRQCLMEFHSSGPERLEARTEKAEPLRGERSETRAEAPDEANSGTQPALPEFQSTLPSRVSSPPPSTQQPVLKMGFAQAPSVTKPEPVSAPDVQTAPRPSQLSTPASPPSALLHVPLRLVGVIGRLYVVLESDRGLVLLDQ